MLDKRAENLLRVLPLYEAELDDSIQSRADLLNTLRKALAAERRRGLDGHWTYDAGRHAALHRLYRAEVLSVGKMAAIMLSNMTDRPEWAEQIKSHEIGVAEHTINPSDMAQRFIDKMVAKERERGAAQQ